MFNALPALSRLLRRVSGVCIACAATLFVALWILGMIHHTFLLYAGGTPHSANVHAGDYYLREHSKLTKVDKATYSRVVFLCDLFDRRVDPVAWATIGLAVIGGLGRLFHRGIEVRLQHLHATPTNALRAERHRY